MQAIIAQDDDARYEMIRHDMDQRREIEWIGGVLTAIVIGYYLIQRAIRTGTKAATPPPLPPPASRPPQSVVAAPDGPGRFRVDGVDRESRMDTSGFYEASSPANAKVKAELEGVIVTHVERLEG